MENPQFSMYFATKDRDFAAGVSCFFFSTLAGGDYWQRLLQQHLATLCTFLGPQKGGWVLLTAYFLGVKRVRQRLESGDFVGGGFNHFHFHPYLGKISNLTHIFQGLKTPTSFYPTLPRRNSFQVC